MKILVYGTQKFEDYPTFMRGLVVAIEENIVKQDSVIQVLTAGPRRINSYTAEFINRSENYFKQKKIRTKFTRVKYEDVLSNMESYDIDYVVSFNSKGDPEKLFDSILSKAEKLNIPASYYRY
jgi:hypothetical protein